jgi:hypothetical protein
MHSKVHGNAAPHGFRHIYGTLKCIDSQTADSSQVRRDEGRESYV